MLKKYTHLSGWIWSSHHGSLCRQCEFLYREIEVPKCTKCGQDTHRVKCFERLNIERVVFIIISSGILGLISFALTGDRVKGYLAAALIPGIYLSAEWLLGMRVMKSLFYFEDENIPDGPLKGFSSKLLLKEGLTLLGITSALVLSLILIIAITGGVGAVGKILTGK